MKRKIEPRHHISTVKNPAKALQVIDPGKWKIYSALALIVLISFIVYLPVFHNGLLSWDDDGYIQNIRQLADRSFNLKDILSRNVMGNWHPLTMLVYTIIYHFSGLNPAGYHAVNLCLHIVNVILVFYAVYLISDKTAIALIAALLFGIHPLHVESVAWAAELKDLLYTLFFLASYICYLKYLKERIANDVPISSGTNYESAHQHISTSAHYYILALALFIFSLFSKALAVSLPLVLILTDYFKGRKINMKTVLEKAPFFLLAVIFGVAAVIAQKSFNAIQDVTIYAFPKRLVFASYGFVSYLIKLVLPINLSGFYAYPVNNSGGIPIEYYAYVLILIALVACIVYSVGFTRKIIFGMGFFTITILLVLQILPVGQAIMADRYGYIPSIGIFYLAGEGLMYLWNKKSIPRLRDRTFGIALFSIVAVLFSIQTYARCGVWKNDVIFWSSVIDYDNSIEEAWYNRGIVYMHEKRNDEAIKDFNRTINLNPGNWKAYYNRGTLFVNEKKYDEAISDFNKAIELNPNYAEAYNNRGSVFVNKKRNEEALADFNKAVELNPENPEAYYNKGLLYMNESRNTEAVESFNKAIELNPGYANAYNNRGIVFVNEKRNSDAISDFGKVIELQPGNASAYNNRGIIYMDEKMNNEAINDFNKAIELNPDYTGAYNNKANLLFEEKRYEEAVVIYARVTELMNSYAPAWYKRGLAEYYAGNRSAACNDLNRAAALGYRQAVDAVSQICK